MQIRLHSPFSCRTAYSTPQAKNFCPTSHVLCQPFPVACWGSERLTDESVKMVELRKAISSASEELQADLILLNAPMRSGLEDSLRNEISGRSDRAKSVVLILVTTGGLADEAYRCARMLQSSYENVTICVAGWCKSAGTLLAIGGHSLIMGPRGELGPLDVQITKRDELFDRDSGLISNAALDRLREESFQFFEQFMLQIIARSQNTITFRTAADISADVTAGLMVPIFDKLDPLRLGADSRAMEIGSAYATRLNIGSKNLKGTEALNMLLNGYPSHSFVIDYKEAEMLFTCVKPLEGSLANVIDALGDLAIAPRDEALVLYLDGADHGTETDEGTDVVEAAKAGDQSPTGENDDSPSEVLRAAIQGHPRPDRSGRARRTSGLS